MTATVRCSALLALALAAMPLPAQQKGVPIKAVETKPAEMAEDVEILRLLLNKSVGLDYHLDRNRLSGPTEAIDIHGYTASVGGLSSGAPGTEPRHYLFTSTYPQFDGVYLNRHGVAFTVRLSSLEQTSYAKHERAAGLEATCLQCHKVDSVAKFPLSPIADPAAKPPTDWEKARDELRGVSKSKADHSERKSNLSEMCRPGNLVESVVKLLTENGRHLRHLGSDESVSVIVTYDGVTGAAQDRRATTLADPTLWLPKVGDEDPNTKFGLTTDETNQISLGDLHLKQGKNPDAIVAYEAALVRFRSAEKRLVPPKGLKPAELTAEVKALREKVAEAYRTLATAYLNGGNLNDAKRCIELSLKMDIKLDGENASKGTPVPAKIILSVKKFHLDAAKTLSPADFRKGVTVETVGMTAMKK